MKAFLSHSSKDKEFVRAVAKELGREFCLFDEQAFETGDEFKASIERGLGDSSVFVLFASKAALASIWVQFELNEAWYGRLRNSLAQSLVYIVDRSVEIEDLPDWLRRALVRREISPKIVARDIRHHLDELLIQRHQPYFVGRTKDIEAIEQAITPLDGKVPPRVFFLHGLPGIGRRSLLRRAVPSILNLRKQVELRIGEGDSINDICATIADQTEPYSTEEGFKRIIAEIKGLGAVESVQRILTNLRTLISSGELPVLLDEGGLLDDEGYLREPVRDILKALPPKDTIYLFFVSHRRPQLGTSEMYPTIPLRPLPEDDVKRLILRLAERVELQIAPNDLSELTKYVAGYPPAAYFTIQQAKEYGIDLVNREKARLVQFRTEVFLRHLTGFTFQEFEQEMLRILAVYSPLPLSVLAASVGTPAEVIDKSIIRLIDLALIISTPDGLYRIADPVGDSAVKVFGYPTEESNKLVAQSLTEFMRTSELETSRLALSRVAFRAALLAKDKDTAKVTLHLANDLIRLTETLYHKRDYLRSIECGLTVLVERPNSVTARSYLIRSLIQEERWPEAEGQLQELKQYGPGRDVSFLAGFLERKRGNTKAAIQHYEKAERAGRRGVALSRELALCYFLERDDERASKYIKAALERHGDNPYVVDLWVQIESRRGDEATARKALSRLEIIDDPLRFKHRLSRVELIFGNLSGALTAAREAVSDTPAPHFEALANLIYCEIQSGNIPAAEARLAHLDKQFGNVRRDIRLAIRCRLEIARHHYKEALLHAERISQKQSDYYRRIRHDALTGELQASALTDETRRAYTVEVDQLRKALADRLAPRYEYADLESALV